MNEQGSAPKGWFSLCLRLAAWGCFAVSLLCFLLVALMIYRGDVWAWGIYAEKPIPHLLAGIAALFVWHLLLHGIRNTRQDWSRFSGRAFLLAFSLAISFLAAEIVVRMYYSARAETGTIDQLRQLAKDGKKPPIRSTHPLAVIIQPSDDPRVVYELQPNLDVNFGGYRVRTNTERMREDRDYAVERSSNSVRIVGIGDSGMFGWDVEQGDEYMAVLETLLNNSTNGVSYEVLNLAVPGYNTQLEVELLRYKGLKYKPDIVIVGWCENDFSLPLFFFEKENYSRKDKSFLFDFLFHRAKNTEVQPGVFIHDLRRYDRSQILPEVSQGADVDGARKSLLQLQETGKKLGFKVVLFGPLHTQIRELCKEINFPTANTLEMIPEGTYPKEYRVYNMHPPKAGHRVLAEHLAKNLAERGWLPAPKPE